MKEKFVNQFISTHKFKQAKVFSKKSSTHNAFKIHSIHILAITQLINTYIYLYISIEKIEEIAFNRKFKVLPQHCLLNSYTHNSCFRSLN